MKRIYGLISLLLVLQPYNVRSEEVMISPDVEYQTVEGWGVSLCWWAHMVGQWEDQEKVNELLHLLTDSDQLNFNVFRYNIGGGDDPSHYSRPGAPGHMAKGKGVRAEMEGFKASPNARYDMTRDAGQRNILLKLNALRDDAVFEAFANSPPYWMTCSGCAGGNEKAGEDNLKPKYYYAFAEYLVDVCRYYDWKYGIRFKTLEPFNEPLTSYWGALGSQEGCHFDVDSQLKMASVLHEKLKSSGLPTVISVSDETCLRDGLASMKEFAASASMLNKIGQFNVHTYSGSDKEREKVRELAANAKKTLWQSESGPNGVRAGGLENNLLMAERLIADMRIMKPAAWLDWQYVEEYNDTWCLIRGNFSGETFTKVKNFYVRMQVTRFIRQGAVIVDSSEPTSLAARNPNGDLVLVLVNSSRKLCKYTVTVKDANLAGAMATLYRTSAAEDCRQIVSEVAGESIELEAPPQSISTLIISK